MESPSSLSRIQPSLKLPAPSYIIFASNIQAANGHGMTAYNPLQLLPLPPTALDPRPIATALTVDPFSDLLWVGSSSGLVTSLCSPLSLTRNVQFPAHGAKSVTGYMGHAPNMSVKEIRVTDRDIWTLTDGGVGGRRRGGAVKWSVRCVQHNGARS